MTDYRSFVESKLADIDRRSAVLENERKRLITAIGVLDEADSASGGVATARPAETTNPDPPPVTSAIVNILMSSGRMMTTNEIHDSLQQDHKVSRDLLHSGFYRLKKRGVAFQDGKKWGLVGHDDKTLTNPTEHQLQPSLSHAVAQD